MCVCVNVDFVSFVFLLSRVMAGYFFFHFQFSFILELQISESLCVLVAFSLHLFRVRIHTPLGLFGLVWAFRRCSFNISRSFHRQTAEYYY